MCVETCMKKHVKQICWSPSTVDFDLVFTDTHTPTARQHNGALPLPKTWPWSWQHWEVSDEFPPVSARLWLKPRITPGGVSGCLIYQHLPGGGSADSCGFQGGASIDWTSSCSNWSLGSWEGGALSSLLTWFCGRAGSSILHDFTHSMGVLFFFFFWKEIRSICMHAGFSQELGILHECSHIRVQTFETY